MQTYSHFLITAFVADRVRPKTAVDPGRAFLLGAVLPDVPLLLLTIGAIITWRLDPATANQPLFGAAYDALYFTNPWWIAGHNLFHAPLLIMLYAAVGYGLTRRSDQPRRQQWGWTLLWFAAGCGLHSLIDIFTHVTDGPVLFFPFNWSYRFRAPVSYWDPQYGSLVFAPLEHALDLLLLGYLGRRWWQARRLRRQPLT